MIDRKAFIPSCPRCRERQTIGVVNTCIAPKNRVITAFFCSNCLTEFDKSKNIIERLYA